MLTIGYECSACGTYLRNDTQEGAHSCLREGALRYSVVYVRNEYNFERVVKAARQDEVTARITCVTDPENYEVTEWIGRAGLGTAYEGERTWGDLWLEENGT